MAKLRHLKDRESKQLIREFTDRFPLSMTILSTAKHLEEHVIEDGAVIFVDGKPWIVRSQGRLYPSLKNEPVLNTLPKIVVDMGAIPHITNGAQIMRPGIRRIEGEFSKDDLVSIIDEKYRKIIALGVAEMDSDMMKTQIKGRVISNIHYVGDPLWNAFVLSK